MVLVEVVNIGGGSLYDVKCAVGWRGMGLVVGPFFGDENWMGHPFFL